MKSASFVLLLSLLATGCHCLPCDNGVPCSEHYCDIIDDTSDCGPRCDYLYHPMLDLTRLGRSDGHACCCNQRCP